MSQQSNMLKILIICLTLLALSASIWARFAPQLPEDLRLVIFIQSYQSEPFRSVMEWFSNMFGGWRAASLVIGISLIVWWRAGIREAILFPAGALLWFINEALKFLIGRPRPSSDQVLVLVSDTNNGFPSGHSFFAILILGLLAYVLFIKLKHRSVKILSLTILVFGVLLVGLSRIYLGAHWPSDVIGGYLFGGLFLTFLIWFHQAKLLK
jgi:undecaprenyl-diphosphatase